MVSLLGDQPSYFVVTVTVRNTFKEPNTFAICHVSRLLQTSFRNQLQGTNRFLALGLFALRRIFTCFAIDILRDIAGTGLTRRKSDENKTVRRQRFTQELHLSAVSILIT